MLEQVLRQIYGLLGIPYEDNVTVYANNRQPSASPSPTPTPKTDSYKARNPSFTQYNPRPSVLEAITSAAQAYQVPPELLLDIALNESGFDPNAHSNTSTAGGLYQFTNPTWGDAERWGAVPQGADKYDPAMNARAAAYMISKGYLGKWDASKPKWGQYYNDKELNPYYGR